MNCDDWLKRAQILLIEFHGEECRCAADSAISNFSWLHSVQGETDCFVTPVKPKIIVLTPAKNEEWILT
jgi:hypothetical protein